MKRLHDATTILGGIHETMDRVEKVAQTKDPQLMRECVLLTIGRLREQMNELNQALLTEALRASIQSVREKKQSQLNGGGEVLPLNERDLRDNVSPFVNPKS